MNNVDSGYFESLIPLIEQMNTLLPVNDDVANGPPPPREEQQKLLQDARDKRDTFAQEKARVENLLNSTLEKVKLYRTLLSATESLLCSSKDLIRSIRFRLQQRGISTRIPPTHALMATTPLPTYNETVDNSENDHPPNDHPSEATAN